MSGVFERINHLYQKLHKDLLEMVTGSTYDDQIAVLMHVSPPHKIVACSAKWEDKVGYMCCESMGKTLSILQGPRTDNKTIQDFWKKLDQVVQFSQEDERVDMDILNYTKTGELFLNKVTASLVIDIDTGKKYFLVLSKMEESPVQTEQCDFKIDDETNLLKKNQNLRR